ncbi:chromosomal replication initiator DnaA [Paroceanicella profunda]|uniref:Chromosomal replication initiator DnaA n=1 Tax=Paroceanicella profunda TaxID=2579971 RepID=A0A5B8FV10_9RHOB|nr:DnaA/Hda family protein [Paroceanicella profunda]QDL92215.1 chromosomal replication initiator DnaA [Paroceanicella profunda]
MTQLIFDLPSRAARDREAFFVSPANADALGAIDLWAAWAQGRLALVGPEQSGKTHLAQVWAGDLGARVCEAEALTEALVPELVDAPLVLENADAAVPGRPQREAALFHLLNAMTEARRPILVTARRAPARWEVSLPDLASRLGAMQVAQIHAPDDALLAALLVKLFDDRQLAVPPELIPYLVTRMERSAREAAALVARLDAEALAAKKSLTPAFAKRILGW